MKRVIIASVIFLFAVIFSISSSYVFKSDMNTLFDSLNEILTSSDSGEKSELKEKIDATEQLWNEFSPVFHVLAVHSGMEEIEQSIMALPVALEHGENELLKEKCIDAMTQIKNLLEAEEISFRNVF